MYTRVRIYNKYAREASTSVGLLATCKTTKKKNTTTCKWKNKCRARTFLKALADLPLPHLSLHMGRKKILLFSEKHLAVSNIVHTFAVYYNAITQEHLSEVCDFLLEIQGFLVEIQGFLLETRGFLLELREFLSEVRDDIFEVRSRNRSRSRILTKKIIHT